MRNRLFTNRKIIIDLLIVVVIAVMAVFVYYRVDQMMDNPKESEKAAAGSTQNNPQEEITQTPLEQEQNEFEAQSALAFNLTNLDGARVALSDFLGNAVMVNFWASWCPPCRAEMPLIQEYAAANQEQLVVLAINAGEENQTVQNFVASQSFEDLNFLLDPTNSVADLYRVPGLPTSLFIDAEGLLQSIHIGELDEDLLTTYLAGIGVK
ncbi:MAG: TlpA disulfide reductase family protein [Chloroflexota bacterium]|nr:TlpA disulfide reductase family protein [Chloroflexota bacterium]